VCSTNYGVVDAALAESNLLSVILDLFFEYEWNNFLHQVSARVLCVVCVCVCFGGCLLALPSCFI
jgi:hypothetical protein